MISRRISIYVIFILLSMIIYGCSVVKHEPIPLVKYVDLDKFMGTWYVIAHIPSYPEKNAFNAVETYKLRKMERLQLPSPLMKGVIMEVLER